MADTPSRASIAIHYAIMSALVVWILGLGFYVFY
jgi:hypothetical protein